MQRIIVSGNLSADVDVQTIDKGVFYKFTVIENSNDYKGENGELVSQPEAFRCQIFRKEKSDKFIDTMKQGKSVSIVGKQKTSSYEKDGDTKYSTIINVDELDWN